MNLKTVATVLAILAANSLSAATHLKCIPEVSRFAITAFEEDLKSGISVFDTTEARSVFTHLSKDLYVRTIEVSEVSKGSYDVSFHIESLDSHHPETGERIRMTIWSVNPTNCQIGEQPAVNAENPKYTLLSAE